MCTQLAAVDIAPATTSIWAAHPEAAVSTEILAREDAVRPSRFSGVSGRFRKAPKPKGHQGWTIVHVVLVVDRFHVDVSRMRTLIK